MLNSQAVYRKTDAGAAEVASRAMGLRAELRRLLILMDGDTTVARLAAFVRGSEISVLIAELESHGLVTTDTSDSTQKTATPATPPTSAPTATTATTAASTVSPIEPTVAQLLAVRRVAIHTLHELLGPAADDLAIKFERCKTAGEMRVVVNEVRLVLDRQMGASTGQRFLEAVRRAADGTRQESR